MPLGDQPLVVTREGGVATLWLNRPDKRNAVDYRMWLELARLATELGEDPDVRLLVVRGVGDHFCAGGDISGLGDLPFEEYRRANELADRALADFPKPSIAFIRGACVGGGAEIAIACDLRLAESSARFGITPARLGIVYPGFAVARAVQLIGESATKHLLFTAEIIDADRALRVGLIDELLEADVAEARLAELVQVMSTQRSLLTQMASKEMVDSVLLHGQVTDEVEARWDAALATSPDAAEGIAAFSQRRTPRFTWAPPAAARSVEPAEPTEPAQSVVPVTVTTPVLGVDGCAGGWVGALLAPDLPRPQVYAAPTIAELVETALQSWSVSVVAINAPADSTPETRAQVDAWRQTRPRCTVVEAHPELSFAEMAGGPMAAAKTTPEGIAAHLAELARHGISRPSVLADSGYAADDLLDACAAAWTAARYVSGDARSLPDPPEVSSDGIPAAIWV
jgi:enoyl-CoA hydratase/carnithine racemase